MIVSSEMIRLQLVDGWKNNYFDQLIVSVIFHTRILKKHLCQPSMFNLKPKHPDLIPNSTTVDLLQNIGAIK